jgi:hypothetical protein
VKKRLRTPWRLWCYALGEKVGRNDDEANTVAIIRTFIFTTYLITNIAIVSNAVRHWNDNDKYSKTSVHENVSTVSRRK